MTSPVRVYDRTYLSFPGKNLVLEYIDGYCDVQEKWVDEWRIIDLNTGEVFAKDPVPQEVLHVVSAMQSHAAETSGKLGPFEYVVEAPPLPELKRWHDLPLSEKLRHVKSLAHDLEHDFSLDPESNECPFQAALTDYQQRYNDKPCFYQTEEGFWEIHESCY